MARTLEAFLAEMEEISLAVMDQEIIQTRLTAISTCPADLLHLKANQLGPVGKYSLTTTYRSCLLSQSISIAGTETTACLHST